MKFQFKKPKSKEEKHREKLLQDYKDGKVLKIETPNHQNNQNHKNNKKKKHNKGRN